MELQGASAGIDLSIHIGQHTPGHYNEEPEAWRRHFVADIGSARSAHRTALTFRRKGFAPEFIQQARAVRDASLVSARLSLQAYRAAISGGTPWHVVPADGTPFRFHVMRHNASVVEYLRSHWERDSKGRSLFRSEAAARAAIAEATGAAS